MLPFCFNVPVYLMVAKDQMVEKTANSSSNDDCHIQDEAGESIDSSFVDLTVVGNLLSSSVTNEDVEAMQASQSTDDINTSAEGNTDCDFPGLGFFPMYRLTVSQARKTIRRTWSSYHAGC